MTNIKVKNDVDGYKYESQGKESGKRVKDDEWCTNNSYVDTSTSFFTYVDTSHQDTYSNSSQQL